MSDHLLELGWLDDPALAKECLGVLRREVDQRINDLLSEADTNALLVETVLRGLGWQTLNLDEVGRETTRGWTFGDFHLKGRDLDGGIKVAAVIEAKALRRNDPGRAYRQLKRDILERLFTGPDPYNRGVRLQLNGQPFVRGVVTNGQRWKVYNFSPAIVNVAPEKPQPDCDFNLQDCANLDQFVKALGKRQLLETLGLSTRAST